MNEKEEIIEMLELLLGGSNPVSKLGFPATLIENCRVDSFDFVLNKAIEYIKEH